MISGPSNFTNRPLSSSYFDRISQPVAPAVNTSSDLSNDTIIPSETKLKKICRIASLIFRMGFAIFSDLALLPFSLGLIAAALFKVRFDPKPENIKHNQIPILLLHGSNFNETQWIIGRQFLKKKEYGSVFSLNYGGILGMDPKLGIEDFTHNKIRAKILDIKEKTGSDEVILIGHSMGGLIAGYYAENLSEQDQVKIKNVISIASPWHGAPAIDLGQKLKLPWLLGKRFDQMSKKGGTKQDPEFRERLVRQALDSEKKGIRKYFNIWSSADVAVPGIRGRLTENPNRQHSFNSSGHIRLVAKRQTWMQVRNWLDPIYAKKI